MKFLTAVAFCLLLTTSVNGQVCLGLGNDGKCSGISLDGLAKGERETNGLQLCAISDGSSCNGLSVGLLPEANTNGVVVGLFVGGLGYVGPPENLTGSVNGLSIGATSSVGTCTGVSIAMLNTTKKQRGISIGIINIAAELHGLQIGMLNYVSNNPPWLRYLPLLNAHF
ncbi:MAG: hypothetical protein ACRYFX_30110 [Janthinobacterium lividum]